MPKKRFHPEKWLGGRVMTRLPDGRRVFGFREEPLSPKQLRDRLPWVMAQGAVNVLNGFKGIKNDELPDLVRDAKRVSQDIVNTLITQGPGEASRMFLKLQEHLRLDIAAPQLWPHHNLPLKLCLWTVIIDSRLSSRLKKCQDPSCGAYFLARRNDQQYCTPRCASRVTSRRYRERK